MKILFYLLLIIILSIPFINNLNGQIIRDNSTKNELLGYGIDPENLNQIMDSLNTKDDFKRWWLIHWIGDSKIYEAIPKLKLLFQQPNSIKFLQDRSVGQKAIILRTIMKLQDTTFQQEFREELDSLSSDDENYY